MWYSPSSVRSFIVNKLTPRRKAWISRTLHVEQPWQQLLDGKERLPASQSSSKRMRSYDSRVEQRQSLAEVRELLSTAGIDFTELPRLSLFGPTLVINENETHVALTALRRGLTLRTPEETTDSTWAIRILNSRGAKLPLRIARRRPEQIASVECLRRRKAPNGRELTTRAQTITIELWKQAGSDVPRGDGSFHLPGTLYRRHTHRSLTVDYVEPTVWEHALRNDARIRLPAPHLRVLQEPVDIVYTWVDGSDTEWRARMCASRDSLDLSTTEPSSLSESRFISRDELKYSLRSIEYYASWARRIFIVTDGQVPPWLDVDHPKITVVDHREIFSDPNLLPVFNSHAIESQLHHIPGLADRYLYLNDDCFFLRPTDPELFFTANGLAKHFHSVVPIDIGGWSPRDLPIVSAAKQGREHILTKYGRTFTHRYKHTPHPQLRPVLEAMELEDPQMFAKVAATPFRSPEDVSIPSSLHHFDAFARGRSIEGQIGYQFVDLKEPDLELRLLRVARRTDLDVFCLNETALDEGAEGAVNQLVNRFFESRFPVPSSFEYEPDRLRQNP